MSSQYFPDKWVVVKITIFSTNETFYRVLASWYGGFAAGDSWKMNSGITKAQLIENCWHFTGLSSSVYNCHKDSYGMSGFTSGVYARFARDIEKEGTGCIEIMSEETDWSKLNYE